MNTPKNDWTTKVLLLAAVGLLSTNLVLMSGVTSSRVAVAAGIPDSGAQLDSILTELKSTNQHFEALQKYLESGALTVKTSKADNKDDK